MIDIAHLYKAKVITIHHNCELEYNRDNTSILTKNIMLYWTRKYESEAVQKSDFNLTLTSEDKNLLISNYGVSDNLHNMEVIGTFEPSEANHVPIHCNDTGKKCRFVITGNLSAKQTVASLIPWIESYYPILKSIFPKSSLIVAGKNPSSSLLNLCNSKGIKIIPSPSSMDIILNNADYYICPISLGGGIKLRIMDGLRNGLPVLTHQVSARGYSEFQKAGILFDYYDPQSFALACKNLKDVQFSKSQIQDIYQENFSFDAGTNRLTNMINHLFYNHI